MVGSDEVIIITNLEWANRFAHVNAVRETCEANGKIASIEPGMGEWGLTSEDLERSAQRTKDAVAALEGKTQCHVTTPLGTDFFVSIEGRPPLCLTPYKAPRPDDEPDPALDRGRLRRDRGLHARHRRRRRRHARHRARGPGEGADPLDARGRQVRRHRGRGGGGAAARRRSTASRTRRSSASSPSGRARRRPSGRRPRRAASAPSTSRSATTTTRIPGGQNPARSTSTASS